MITPTGEYRRVAMTMEDQGSDVFQSVSGPVVARWFKSPLGAELTIWRAADRALLQFQLSLFGEIAQWSALAGLQTGMVIERDGGETLRFDDQPQGSAIARARAVLTDMLGIDDAERSELGHRLASTLQAQRQSTIVERVHGWCRFWRQRICAMVGLQP